MPKRYTPNDVEVAELLQNVMRLGIRTYGRVAEDGSSYIVPIRAQLCALGIAPKQATALLREADLPVSPYIKTKVPEPEPDPEAMVEAALEAAAMESARQEKLAKKAELEERANDRRWQLISTNSGKWGIWDNDGGSVISLYLTRQEAIDELARIRAGSSQAGVYHFGSRRLRQPELQGAHY